MRAVHFVGLALLFVAVSAAPAAEATESVEGMESCDACENQVRPPHVLRAALLPRTPAHSRSPTLTPTTCPRHPRSSTQMFDCSDMCDCAWGGSDIVQCMMCNSKCTKKKCAEYCEKLAAGGKRRAPLSAATMGNMFGGGQ